MFSLLLDESNNADSIVHHLILLILLSFASLKVLFFIQFSVIQFRHVELTYFPLAASSQHKVQVLCLDDCRAFPLSSTFCSAPPFAPLFGILNGLLQ